MISSRAVLFGFIGACFYLIALVNSLPPLFYALAWLTVGILVSCLGVALLSLYGLRASWTLESSGVGAAAPLDGPRGFFDDDEDAAGTSTRVPHAVRTGERAEEETGASAGEDAASFVGVTLEIGNAGTFSKSGIVIEVRLQRKVARDEAPSAPGSEDAPAKSPRARRRERSRTGEVVVRRFLIEALPARALLVASLPLSDLERGRYRVVSVRAIGSDVLGLFRPRKTLPPAAPAFATEEPSSQLAPALKPSQQPSQQQAPGAASFALRTRDAAEAGTRASPSLGAEAFERAETSDIVVGPRLVRLSEERGLRARGLGGSTGGTASLAGRSDEFGGTRPYVAGDDLRFVHWKSTARRGELVVREWERAAVRRSFVVWDGEAFAPAALNAAASTSGASSREERTREEMREAWERGVEWSLEVALSLSNVLVRSGEPCVLWRVDERPAAVEVASAAVVARGAALLADAHAERATALADSLSPVFSDRFLGARGGSGRAFIIAPTPGVALAAAAARLRSGGADITLVLVDAARLDELVGGRTGAPARAAWRREVDEATRRAGESGLRVVRLPLEDAAESADRAAGGREVLRPQRSAPEARSGEPFRLADATRAALQALLEEPAAPRHAARSGASSTLGAPVAAEQQ
jgi:uncharacterized protein (DUF58 family)